MKAQIVWQTSPAELGNQIEDWWQRVEAKLASEMEALGADLKVYAQANHPWTNRTGQAEAQLNYSVIASGTEFEVVLYQGVYYGVYLEMRWGGRWGVIPAALAANYGRAIQAMMNAMSG